MGEIEDRRSISERALCTVDGGCVGDKLVATLFTNKGNRVGTRQRNHAARQGKKELRESQVGILWEFLQGQNLSFIPLQLLSLTSPLASQSRTVSYIQ